MQNAEKSYKSQEDTYASTQIEEDLKIYKDWFHSGTTDIWRHKRMLSVLDPFLSHDKSANWLTVGDGRFGTSATYIQMQDGNAIATDIDIRLLEIAKAEGMIKEFRYANAEKLPFEENQFDYAYCKQAYHHFPRPGLAVYEMLRVAKNAVVFTEPHDFVPVPFLRKQLQKIKHVLKRILGIKIPHHDTGNYEEIGNYVYCISVREFEKIALGLGLPGIAFKRFHDHYERGVEKEIWNENAALFNIIKKKIRIQKIKTRLRIDNPNNIQMVIFKAEPSDPIMQEFKKEGYTILTFSKNPYQ